MQPYSRVRTLGKYGLRARLPDGKGNPDYYKAKRKEFKRKVIDHYSQGTMACANPFSQHEEPYTDIRALQVDHINGGGNKERRSLGKPYGSTLFAWLIRHNYPEGYQVLCANCNWIKSYVNGERQ